MKNWAERALNLRPGDLGRGMLLSSYLFLIISSYVVGKVARDALFLARFQAVQLPYVDIASAVLVGFVVAGYVRLGRRISLRNLLVGSLVFFATNCALFWAVAHYYHPAWLFPVFYVWVGIFGVLAPTQVWALANYVLTTRDAKRIFGLVGGGAISGSIFAGLCSKTVAKAFGTESLLLCMALALVFCPSLVILICRRAQLGFGSQDEMREGSRDGYLLVRYYLDWLAVQGHCQRGFSHQRGIGCFFWELLFLYSCDLAVAAIVGNHALSPPVWNNHDVVRAPGGCIDRIS
jgi:AAA family ATP:ADP antiporter